MVDADDWRLTGQESYLHGKTLYWRRWSSNQEVWDHDHCSFCWANICTSGDGLDEAWATHDNYHWICASCCDDFREKFEWTLDRPS